MIEIENTIELQTNSETEKLLFKARYLVSGYYTFDLSVKSASFGGTSYFCIQRDEIELFCSQLSKIHATLIGFTKITDYDSDSFVSFHIETNGHLLINGQVGGSHEDHFMKFSFQTDQTCLTKFIEDFKALLKK